MNAGEIYLDDLTALYPYSRFKYNNEKGRQRPAEG